MRFPKKTPSILGAVFLALACSCTKSAPKPEGPEAALEAYVKLAFNAKSLEDGRKLLDLSTGEAKEWLASLSEDGFKKQFIDNQMVLQSFHARDKVQEKNGDVSVVYEVGFKDGRGPEPLSPNSGLSPSPAAYSIKKIAYLTKEGDYWKIKATKNIKSFVERKDALEILTPESKR